MGRISFWALMQSWESGNNRTGEFKSPQLRFLPRTAHRIWWFFPLFFLAVFLVSEEFKSGLSLGYFFCGPPLKWSMKTRRCTFQRKTIKVRLALGMERAFLHPPSPPPRLSRLPVPFESPAAVRASGKERWEMALTPLRPGCCCCCCCYQKRFDAVILLKPVVPVTQTADTPSPFLATALP